MIALLLFVWLAVTNHCALARLTQCVGAKTKHACCHSDSTKPADERRDGGQGMECCKTIRAVVPDGVKVAGVPPESAPAIFAAVPFADVAEMILPVSARLTGPPTRAHSFAELVLHGSLRSHAPPFAA